MYILKRILISLPSAVFPHKNFVKILLLYGNLSIRQFVANDAFEKLKYQSQAWYLKIRGQLAFPEFHFETEAKVDFPSACI